MSGRLILAELHPRRIDLTVQAERSGLRGPYSRPRQVLIIGALALLLATTLILWAVFAPARFELPVVRFFACVGVSLYLSVFFYVFWPQKSLGANVKPIFAAKEFRVAGPIVLFFLSLSILWGMVPASEYPYRQIFRPEERIYYDRTTSVEKNDRSALVYHLIRSKEKPDLLEGVYIEFAPGEEAIEAVFTHNGLGREVKFTRGKSSF